MTALRSELRFHIPHLHLIRILNKNKQVSGGRDKAIIHSFVVWRLKYKETLKVFRVICCFLSLFSFAMVISIAHASPDENIDITYLACCKR